MSEPTFEDQLADRLGGEVARAWRAGEINRAELLAAASPRPAPRKLMRMRRVVEFLGSPERVLDQARRSLKEGEHVFPQGGWRSDGRGDDGRGPLWITVAKLGEAEMLEGEPEQLTERARDKRRQLDDAYDLLPGLVVTAPATRHLKLDLSTSVVLDDDAAWLEFEADADVKTARQGDEIFVLWPGLDPKTEHGRIALPRGWRFRKIALESCRVLAMVLSGGS